MQIAVQGTVIETKDIVDVYDCERDKTMFRNREAGFIIQLVNGKSFTFSQKIPYESYPSEIQAIHSKWQRLMNSVIEEWNKDRNEIKNLTL